MNQEQFSDHLKLSILDLATIYNHDSATETLQHSTNLVQLADQLGYTRYWFAEHHNTRYQMSTSPDLLAAHAAALTKRIRIGSGGIMIPNHSPLKVVENFSLLEALHPGRIDLGMGRASGTDGLTQIALRNNDQPLARNDVMEQLYEILAFFQRDFSKEHPYSRIIPSADALLQPDIFMLGSSDGGMKIAATLGLGFAFAGQINPGLAIPVLRSYREYFQPSEILTEPYSILSIIVICAPTDEEAKHLAGPAELQWVRWETGQYHMAPPTMKEASAYVYTNEEAVIREQNKGRFVIGSVENVKKQLENLAEEAKVDEIMILNMITDPDARKQSYTLLAKAFYLA